MSIRIEIAPLDHESLDCRVCHCAASSSAPAEIVDEPDTVRRIAGIPAVGWGTSLTGMAHQPDERISIENLMLGVKVYTAFPFIYGT